MYNKGLVFPRKKGYIPFMAEMEAYCVKCRAKRMMKDGREVTVPGKGGERRAMTGLCSTCGTKMFRILGKKGN